MASEFLHQCQSSEYYDVNIATLNITVDLIVRSLQDIQLQVITLKKTQLTSDYQDNTDLADQCDKPFEQSFLNDKKYMFYKHIYDKCSEQWTLKQCQCYLTSFKVKQNMFIVFFDHFDEEPEDSSAEDRVVKNVNMMNSEDEVTLPEFS